MSDPIPSASSAAAADADSDAYHRLPTNAEDRKAAAALSSLNTNEIGADSSLAGAGAGVSSHLLPSTADQEALGKAMSRLEIAAGGGKGNAGKKAAAGGAAETQDRKAADAATTAAAAAKKKAVKVSVEDVNLLMDELDMSKIKATELLKMNSGDVRSAVHVFLTQRGGW